MNPRRWRITSFNNRDRLLFCYAVVWALGILLGVAIPVINREEYMVLITAAKLRPNLFFLFLSNAIPLIALIALITVRRYGFIYVILLLYGTLRGYCGMYVTFAFGSGGWLVRCLLLFSSSLVSVVMWWLILSSFDRKHRNLQLICCSVLSVCCVTLFDYFIISPFLMGII